MKLALLLTVLQCLHPLVRFCSACLLPTENNRFSVCAYCSDKHAGVRWMMHESNNLDYLFLPDIFDLIEIKFQCHDPENNTVFDRDDCFDGTRLPVLSNFGAGKWNWYILERELNKGTECNFTTKLRNSFTGSRSTVDTSTCTVQGGHSECSEGSSSSTDCLTPPIPAICSGGEPGDSVCSCSCNHGFTELLQTNTVTLRCNNVNECETEDHQCADVRDCVDTEGGYYCLSSSTNIQSTTTIAPRTTTIGISSGWIESTAIAVSPGPSVTLMPSSVVDEASLTTMPWSSSSTDYETLNFEDTSMHVSQSAIVAPVTASIDVTEAGADIKLLVGIPLSVTVLIVFGLISLLFTIALNRYHSNDSVHKMITSWQAHDKFDPEFIPEVEIDRNFGVKHSVTQESIIASLEHTTGAQAGEHVLCTDQLLQDAERENTISCNTSDNIAHDHKIIPPNETTDSGIMLSSGQNSSNYQDTNVSPISAFTGGLVEHSSSSSSSDLSEHAAQLQGMHDELQEHNEQALLQTTLSGADVISSSLNSVTHTSAVSDNVTEPTKAKCTTLNESHDHTEYCQALVHPSGTNTAFNSQTVGWTLFNSSHATESQGQMTTVSFGTLEPLAGAGGYVHEHAQNSVVISSGSISPELDKMNGLLSISSESLSCFLDVDTTLMLDDITNDHLNANTDSTGCNISTNNYHVTRLEVPSESIRSDSTVEQYYHEQQVPMYTIDQAENSLYQAHGGRSTAGITNNLALVHVTGMDGSSLSLMCDTEY